MMSLETTKRVWQARLDPRWQTPSMGFYSQVRERSHVPATRQVDPRERAGDLSCKR